MSDVKAGWSKVGEQFRELGDRLREHYREAGPAGEAATAPEGSATDAEATEEPAGTDEGRKAEAKVKEVVDQLAAAADRIADTVRDAAKDPELKADAGAAANSLVDALAVTFEELGEEFKGLVDQLRKKKDGGAKVEPDEVHEEE